MFTFINLYAFLKVLLDRLISIACAMPSPPHHHSTDSFIQVQCKVPKTPTRLQMSPFKVEASDFEGKDIPESILQYKDELLGKYVPEVKDADKLSMEWMREGGYKDLRDYLVQCYLGHA